MQDLLKDRVAIVTGGARGIGAAVCRRLVEQGARVMIADLDPDATAQTVDELGPAAAMHCGDLTRPEMADAVTAATVERFGGIDILVNNAGYHWDARLVDMTDEQFQAMLDIHTMVPFRLMRAAGRHMIEVARGEKAAGEERFRKIVNVSSLAATFGNAGAANYSAAKAGVIGLTKAAAKEWGRYKINVNAVAFGVIKTRFAMPQTKQNELEVGGHSVRVGIHPKTLEKRGVSVDEGKSYSDEEIYRPLPMKNVPLGRSGRVEEAAGAIFYLCSPLADYVHGQVHVVSGGVSGGMT